MEKVLVKNDLDILEMCKISKSEKIENKNETCLFTNLTRDMFKDNKYLLDKYFRNENAQECYYANLLCFAPLKDTITLYEIKKALKKDFGKSISLAGFKYKPEHYKYATAYMQQEYEEDLFRETEDEDIDSAIEPIDFDAVESLYTCLFEGIKARIVLVFHLEDIPGIINNAFDCYNKGVTCSASNNAMHAKIAEIRRLLEDPKVIEWRKTKPTDLAFDKEDYIESYQKLFRQMSSIKDEPLEYFRALLETNHEDLFIEEIIANDCIETEPLFANNDLDEDELDIE